MSKRFEVLAPTDDSETSNRDNKKKQDTFSKNTLEKRENRFKSKTKNTRFNFPLEKSENKDRPQRYNRDESENKDRPQRYNRDESDNRNSFQRKPRRQFRESFFDRKKYAKQQEVNKTPKPPKNFTLNENDFPTL
mgnify:CR=1 FL=1